MLSEIMILIPKVHYAFTTVHSGTRSFLLILKAKLSDTLGFVRIRGFQYQNQSLKHVISVQSILRIGVLLFFVEKYILKLKIASVTNCVKWAS